MTYSSAAKSRLLISALLCACLCAPLALPADAQSFTANRLEQGRQQLLSGNYTEAAVEFNLAAIGLIDEPNAYTHCKTLLFLAQIGARERAQAKATLLLIARVEEQFGSYSAANIPEGDRLAFETTVNREFGDEAFTQAPRFGNLMRQAAVRDQPEVNVSEATTLGELRAQAEANPQDVRALEALTIRLYQDKKVAEAQRSAEDLLALEPGNPSGACIQATTRAARNRSLCERYLPEMAQCQASLQTGFYIETRLTCHLESRTYNAGREFVESLSPAALTAANVNGLVRKINRRADPRLESAAEQVALQGATQDVETESPSSAVAPQPETDTAAPPLSEGDDELLARVTELARQGTTAATSGNRDLLVSTQAQVRELADRHPELAEAQTVAGRFAYLLRDWANVIVYFGRAEQRVAQSANSTYYLAVALWESGDLDAARVELGRALDLGLVRTDPVRSYESKMFPGSP